MRRLAAAFTVFAVGVVVGFAVLRPAHSGLTTRERQAERAVEAASGGNAVRVACTASHCGVVVRLPGAVRCQGWIVPIHDGSLEAPTRAAFAHC